VVKTARFLCGFGVVAFLLAPSPANAQRVQFPTPDPSIAPTPSTPDAGLTPPMATFDGTIQPPPADWDPYAAPGASQPPTLLPQDPFQAGPGAAGVAPYPAGGTFATMQRFLQEIRFDYVYMPGSAADELGINDLELSATFAIPFLYNTETPLLVTPGFAIHYFNGPPYVPADPESHDVPPRVYDAYLDAAWNPQVTPWLGGELSARVGVYADFEKVVDESFRLTGSGYAVLSFSPSMTIKAGAMYLDRNRVKLLPSGGLIWTPNPDIRFEILFPNPKIARRLPNVGNTEWWGYIRGDYGGGAWTMDQPGGDTLEMDYNDIRLGLGAEFFRPRGLSGLFEVGLAFDRELYALDDDFFTPNSTVYLRGGLAY